MRALRRRAHRQPPPEGRSYSSASTTALAAESSTSTAGAGRFRPFAANTTFTFTPDWINTGLNVSQIRAGVNYHF